MSHRRIVALGAGIAVAGFLVRVAGMGKVGPVELAIVTAFQGLGMHVGSVAVGVWLVFLVEVLACAQVTLGGWLGATRCGFTEQAAIKTAAVVSVMLQLVGLYEMAL